MNTKEKRSTKLANVEIYYLDWKKAVLDLSVNHIAAIMGAGYLPRDYYRRVATMRVNWDPSEPLFGLERLWISFNGKKGEHTMRRIRDMNIGDFVVVDGIGWFCDTVGWVLLAEKMPLPNSGKPADYTEVGDRFYVDNEEWEFNGATWQLINNRSKFFNGPGVGLRRLLSQDPTTASQGSHP